MQDEGKLWETASETLFKLTPSVNESAAWVLRGVRKPAKEGDRGASD